MHSPAVWVLAHGQHGRQALAACACVPLEQSRVITVTNITAVSGASSSAVVVRDKVWAKNPHIERHDV